MFQMRVAPGFLENIDNWRKRQDDLPGRAEAIRRLVEKALAGENGNGTMRKPRP
jgi:hypothetical protein